MSNKNLHLRALMGICYIRNGDSLWNSLTTRVTAKQRQPTVGSQYFRGGQLVRGSGPLSRTGVSNRECRISLLPKCPIVKTMPPAAL